MELYVAKILPSVLYILMYFYYLKIARSAENIYCIQNSEEKNVLVIDGLFQYNLRSRKGSTFLMDLNKN